MIEELNRSLERWLRAEVPLPNDAVEVGFEQPESTWDVRRPSPMVNLFLYDLARSSRRARAGGRLVTTETGGYAREPVTPVVEARYVVSVWGGGSGSEHDLLGRIVALLARSRAIPPTHLTDALRLARPAPTLSLAVDERTSLVSLWGALGVPARAGAQLLVETPLSAPLVLPAADPPATLDLRTQRVHRPAAYSRRRRLVGRTSPDAAGGRVTTRRGSARIEDSGRYNVEGAPGDEVHVEPPPARHGDADG